MDMEVPGKRVEISVEGTAKDQDNLCDLCAVDDVTTTANGKCRECEEYMCSMCFRHHLKLKLCRHHVLVDINKSLTPIQRRAENVEKCKRHANEAIKYYCRKHGTVGCGDCMIPAHSACKPENIKDLSKEFEQNEDFKSIMAKIEDIVSANNVNGKKIQDSKKENKQMLEEALKTIKNFRSEVNKYLDKAEGNIIMEVKEIERNNDKLLVKLEHDCKLLSSEITEVRQRVDTELYKESALFIQCIKCKPKIMDIERTCTKIQRENEITKFKFIPDEELVITSIAKLGQVTRVKSSAKSGTTALTELPHSSNVSNSRASKEEVTEREKPMKNDRNREIEEKQKRPAAAGYIAVGSRVRPTSAISRSSKNLFTHRCQPGSVTAVRPDGRNDVKRDATSRTRTYTLGKDGDVELI